MIENGLVVKGSKNIFTVRVDGGELTCGIKGKILKGIEGYYNPIAPGDIVDVERDPLHPGSSRILSVRERSSLFVRFNQKEQKPQALAANIDRVLCVTTPASPPFRPRFLDRILVQAGVSGVEALIVCNKYDLDADPFVEERLEDYRRTGYELVRVSAKTGLGMDELRSRLAGKNSVLVGQSGVGKSSLINALIPSLKLATGALNEKYDRGNHTTALSVLFELEGRGSVIDTPGIRRMVPCGLAPADIILYMKEFAPLAGSCAFGLSCSHRSEKGCAIREAVAAGTIHEDRYESFIRIRHELDRNA